MTLCICGTLAGMDDAPNGDPAPLPDGTPAVRDAGGHWLPGVSGNPEGGRRVSIRRELRAWMTTQRAADVINRLYELAIEGDVRAIALLIDSADGKLPTRIGGVQDDDGAERPIPLLLLPPPRAD